MHQQNHESIEDNLRFLIREVRRQIDRSRGYLQSPSRALRRSLVARDDYIDNLRTFIQRGCFARAAEHGDIEYLKSVDIIAVNLERIADFCESLIDQFDHFPADAAPPFEHFTDPYEIIERGLAKVEPAVLRHDVHLALEIAESEPTLDAMYAKKFTRCLEALSDGESPQREVTELFMWHYFERIGDSLLNIGEAVISAALGEKIKVGQLWALQSSLREAGSQRSIETLQLSALGESKSGALISRVTSRDAAPEPMPIADTVIFKEGASRKVQEERDAIALWESYVPGLVPKAFSFHDAGQHSAILLEYLPGSTFEDLLLQGEEERVRLVLGHLTATLETIWRKTRTEGPLASGFVEQLRARLADVLNVHPTFGLREADIGNIRIPSLHSLVERAAEIEAGLYAPFAVLTHGDLNIDNVIYGQDERVRLIDLHRSKLGDYVQDVSVFIVSNLRLQIFESRTRKAINRVTLSFYDFAKGFAQSSGDHSFDLRLAYGLARSFATSTRFVLDEPFAKSLFLRARYLLERIASVSPETAQSFELPTEVIVD